MLNIFRSLDNPAGRGQAGFTLIELLTVISIIGILAALSVSSYKTYVGSAGYSVARQSLGDARIALEASLVEPDRTYSAVNYTQNVQGMLNDASAAQLLPQFQVSRQTSFELYHDPDCLDASCLSDRLMVRHCRGTKYTYWTRFGDGAEATLEDVPGAGC